MNKLPDINHLTIRNGLLNIVQDKQDEQYQLMDEQKDLMVAKISHQGSAISRFQAGFSLGPIAFLGYILRDKAPGYRMILAACVPLIFLRYKRYEIKRVNESLMEHPDGSLLEYS